MSLIGSFGNDRHLRRGVVPVGVLLVIGPAFEPQPRATGKYVSTLACRNTAISLRYIEIDGYPYRDT